MTGADFGHGQYQGGRPWRNTRGAGNGPVGHPRDEQNLRELRSNQTPGTSRVINTMKYVIVLPDGAADEPLHALDGRTPLDAARTPGMDWVAEHGQIGRVVTVPDGFTPATDVATLSLFGYDPHIYYAGRAPIEAVAQGLSAAPDELIFRCNFVTIQNGRMRDFTAGHIRQDEADRLIADLNALAADGEPVLTGCAFHTGVSYRNLMILSDAADIDIRCAPPHDIPDQPISQHLPYGSGADRIRAIMQRAGELLRDHEINRRRHAEGRPPVTDIWLWGQGQPVRMPSITDQFGVSGVAITGVDIIRGLALMMGLELVDVPGATGYLDTDYAGKGAAAVGAVADHDLVVVHVEAPDEAGHLGDPAAKVQAIEAIDAHIVQPLLETLSHQRRWRIMIAPDHPTPCTTTAHDATPPPYCIAGFDLAASGARGFSEREADVRGTVVSPGHNLLPTFIDARAD